MSMFRRAMDYLGLGDDGSYDDYQDEPQNEQDFGRDIRDDRRGGSGYGQGNRTRFDDSDGADDLQTEASIRRQQEQHDSGLTIRPPVGRRADASVRAVSPSTTPITVCPQSYEEVKGIVDHFRKGTPVIIDLQDTDTRVMRRILDFASGVCYAQGGGMEKVSSGVFMMKPSGARVTRG
ncbi:MAG: cell division protein SepF [Actinobacteria bacterium]|nr:cell division protein SepF [Actinomycetota bacterium]